jgi:hypothetical protein
VRGLSPALALLAALAPQVTAAPARLQGFGIDETLAATSLRDLRPPAELPLWVRLLVEEKDLLELGPLDARLELYHARGAQVLLALSAPPPAPAESEPWRQSLKTLATRYRGRVQAYEVGRLPQDSPRPPAGDYAYLLKLAAVEIRAADPDALIVWPLSARADFLWEESLYREGIAAYVDGVALPAPQRELQALIEREDPTASILVTGARLGADPAEDVVATAVRHLAEKIALTTWTGEPAAIAPALSAASRFKDLFSGEVVTLDEQAADLELGGEARPSRQLLYNLANFSTYLVLWGSSGPLQVALSVASGDRPIMRPLEGPAQPVGSFERDEAAGTSRFSLGLEGRLLLVEFSYGPDSFAARTVVSAQALPSVEEIIFRHQQAQAAQDALLRSYQARARVEVHFRPSTADAGFDVVTDNNFYYDRGGSEWEELSFIFNGARWGSDRPAFPLLQPEKVLSLPLDLRLSKDYRYRLEGTERVGERDCYVVAFAPVSDRLSLYRGTVWIDQQSFLRVKVRAVQTRLSPPVVSNDETQSYLPAGEVEGRPVHLLGRLQSKQLFLIAGRNLLVERTVAFSDFQINSPDFLERRAAARSSEHIMLRDTDQGLRYFVKRGGERVVSEELTRSAKALAMGVTVDPSFDFPLPIFGINYLDFDFLDRDLQFALLFGGVLALGNVQQPKALGTPLDVSLDFFAIAVPVNDQVFGEEGEVREERLKSIPFATGVNVGYQFTSFQKLTFSYQFRYDIYFADDRTAADFRPPPDTPTNAFGASYEYRRRGYSLTASGSYNRRGAWEKWGAAETPFDPEERNYFKYSAGLSKDFFFRTFHKVHLDGAYFGGSRLDRFSTYQFGLFSDTKMHGVPSAGIRFGELVLLHGSYSFNLFDQYRLDLFLDQGWGRSPLGSPGSGAGSNWERLTGVGAAVNMRAPRKTVLRVEVGKSFLPRLYSGSGSTVLQVLLLKPL